MLIGYQAQEMALNENDRDWIRLTIGEALRQKSKGLLAQFKSWSPLGAGVAVGLFVLLQWNGYTIFRVHTEDQLKAIEGNLGVLRTLVSSSQPTKKQNQDAAKDILAKARQKTIPSIPESVVGQAGESFIEASQSDASAWPVALDFVSYRSSLNGSAKPSELQPSELQPKLVARQKSDFDFHPFADKPKPKLAASNLSLPIEQAARLDSINVDQNKGHTYGPAFLLAIGGAMTLDRMHFRNVVVENVEVHYSGQPLILEDVIFINCAFVFDNNDPGRKLGEAVLASASVNFRAAS
jgi:hypothetical protein